MVDGMSMVAIRVVALAAAALALACSAEATPSRRLLFDFEGDEPSWTVTKGNLSGVPVRRSKAWHRHGRQVLDTGNDAQGKFDLELRGKLRSPPFEIDHAFLVFRVGGNGAPAGCAVTLRSAETDEKLRSLPKSDLRPARMQTVIWDVADLRGESVVLQLLDRGKGEGKNCSIHLDYVRLVDG
jgi:hypothetical protein